jgi:hypothetical protein
MLNMRMKQRYEKFPREKCFSTNARPPSKLPTTELTQKIEWLKHKV